MPVRLANIGYLGIGKETVKGTAVTPTIYVPLYDDTMDTKANIDYDNPIVGQKAENFDAYRGMRTHDGDITVLAEPNTAAHFINMILTKGTTTGAGPYTHPFTLDNVNDPKSYTMDICKGQTVHRYSGAEIEQVDIIFDKNKMMFKLKINALAAFVGREVASVTGTGPTTITLKTNYESSPTDGLVASDLVRAQVAGGGATTDTTITSITNGTQFVVPANLSTLVAGDLIFLRAATPSYALRAPFMWAKTQFQFGATASAALAAAQTRSEKGSKWLLIHTTDVADRSGDFDPAALIRRQAHIEADVKLFFDTLDDWNRFITVSKRALVIRHYSEDTTYELRITLNNVRAKEAPLPTKTGEIIFQTFKFQTTYDSSDAQAFDIKVINNLATV